MKCFPWRHKFVFRAVHPVDWLPNPHRGYVYECTRCGKFKVEFYRA